MVSIDKSNKKSLKNQVLARLFLASAVASPLSMLSTLAAHAADKSVPSAFLPSGTPIAAPTAFLEMCARSPTDCEKTSQADDAGIVTLARQALVAKYEKAFSHSKDPAPGAVVDRLQGTKSNLQPALDSTLLAATAASAADYARIPLNTETFSILKSVNQKVNRNLIADTDSDVYHVSDYWEAPALVPGARGDCEDFALAKRRLLVAQGIPAAAISLAIVRTRFNEDHAVLVVSTSTGDYVLDNLSSTVKSWEKTGYIWISRQAPDKTLGWISLLPAVAKPARDLTVAAIR